MGMNQISPQSIQRLLRYLTLDQSSGLTRPMLLNWLKINKSLLHLSKFFIQMQSTKIS